MSTATYVSTELEHMVCATCGVGFALPAAIVRKCRQNGATDNFYCPNGHANIFTEGETARLRREKAALQEKYFAEQRAHEATQRKMQEAEKAAQKLKKRISKGVCPCCKRTVGQLARHMKTKHPDYPAENNPVASGKC